MRRFLNLVLLVFPLVVSAVTTNRVAAIATKEALEDVHRTIVAGEPRATRSETADYLRQGRSGEMGYGYAYTVTSGDGHKRFGAYVPSSAFQITLESQAADDPVIAYYGSTYTAPQAFTRAISAVDSADYDTPGQYGQVTAVYTPTNGSPFSATVVNTGMPSLQTIATTASYLELYVGGTYHYMYGFTAYPALQTISYTDSYYDESTWMYVDRDRTIHVTLSGQGSSAKEFIIFGDAGAYATPSEVTSQISGYIQSHPIQRTVLKERTGKENELGDGWGYMVYDWTSDMRSWQIKIPSLVLTPTYTPTNTSGTFDGGGFIYPSNPLLHFGFICGTITERVKSTHDKQGVDGVRVANAYYTGWGFTNETGTVASPLVRIDADNLVYGSALYNTYCTVDPVFTNMVLTFDWGCRGSYYTTRSNAYHCTLSNFRATNSGLTYDNKIQWTQYNNGVYRSSGTMTTYPVCGFTLTRNTSALRAVTTPAVKIATIASSHYFWDPGLKCTWAISTTNGCFFAEKVSNEDLTRKD